jgi:predicted dehydrogenase
VQKLRLGIIGIGQTMVRTLTERPGIADLPYVQITAAADPRRPALEVFQRDFGGQVFETAEALVQSPDVDAVYVSTPPELHASQAILAAEHKKHVIVEKPMALSLADCLAMNEAAERNGVKLIAAHTHSFDAPIKTMREIIQSGDLGGLRMLNTWNFNEFNQRPWPYRELRSTHGPILDQANHQVDILRFLGGGLVKSVRAHAIWDDERGTEGGFTAFLQFADGVPATMVYDARGFFETSELFWGIGEGGTARNPATNLDMRARLASVAGPDAEQVLEEQKEGMRYGAVRGEGWPGIWSTWRAGHGGGGERHQPFFGLTVVSCERGAMRQYPDTIMVYGTDRKQEIPIEPTLQGRQAEIAELWHGLTLGAPIMHDGRWGQATMEVCLAILQSSAEGREIQMRYQTPVERS